MTPLTRSLLRCELVTICAGFSLDLICLWPARIRLPDLARKSILTGTWVRRVASLSNARDHQGPLIRAPNDWTSRRTCPCWTTHRDRSHFWIKLLTSYMSKARTTYLRLRASVPRSPDFYIPSIFFVLSLVCSFKVMKTLGYCTMTWSFFIRMYFLISIRVMYRDNILHFIHVVTQNHRIRSFLIDG